MSLGEQLQTARKQQGQTIEDVARTTFIRAQYLEAIERNDFSAIPPSRLRYFIQDFAKTTGLNPAEMVALIPDDVASLAAPLPSATSAAREKAILDGQSRVIEESTEDSDASTTSEEGGEAKRRKPRYAPIEQGNPAMIRGLMTVAVVLLAGLGIYYLVGGFDKSADSGQEEETTAAADTASPGSEARILSRPDDTATDTDVIVESGDSLVLEGRAKARVWYSIRMDSRQETGTLDSGDVKVWKAEKEFSVSLGNAGGLEFFMSGASLGTLGPMGATLRGRVINADGVQQTSPQRRRVSRQPTSSGTQNTESGNRLRRLEDSEPRRAIEPQENNEQ